MVMRFKSTTEFEAQLIMATYHTIRWQAVYIHNNWDDQGTNIYIQYNDSLDPDGDPIDPEDVYQSGDPYEDAKEDDDK